MLGFFFWGQMIEYLFVYTIAQSRTFAVFYRIINFASQNLHNFLIFPAPCQKACIEHFMFIS